MWGLHTILAAMPTNRPHPVITLTTDFGLTDHYVGTMKGVILSRCPHAHVVDISHGIEAFSLYSGAYTIDQAAPFYPPGTVHVVVIDPGVGTARKPLLSEALGQYFVAPDNGVLSMILARDANACIREITNRALWLNTTSSTFHGRDVFAPVAAALTAGAAQPSDVGPVIENVERLPGLEAKQIQPGTWQGKVLSIDRFGNVITNFRVAQFRSIASEPFTLLLGNGEVTQWRATFGQALREECFAYFGSSGYVEAGMNQTSAAIRLNISPGDSIIVELQ